MLNASKHEARPKISSPNPLRRIRRAVEDYDFDRLEVEAQQCVELTRTNRPFGLIIKLSQTVFEGVEASFASAVCSIRVELVMPANFCCRTRDFLLRQENNARVTRFRWLYREGHTRSHPEHGS